MKKQDKTDYKKLESNLKNNEDFRIGIYSGVCCVLPFSLACLFFGELNMNILQKGINSIWELFWIMFLTGCLFFFATGILSFFVSSMFGVSYLCGAFRPYECRICHKKFIPLQINKKDLGIEDLFYAKCPYCKGTLLTLELSINSTQGGE